jgi:hypothetical protein
VIPPPKSIGSLHPYLGIKPAVLMIENEMIDEIKQKIKML